MQCVCDAVHANNAELPEGTKRPSLLLYHRISLPKLVAILCNWPSLVL